MNLGMGQRGKGRVLVLGGRSPVALGVARLFRDAGYEVFGGDCFGFTLVGCSNSVREYFRTPPPAVDLVGYEKFICSVVREKKIDLIVPVCEEVFYLASFKDRLPLGCELFCSTIETLNLLHNKFTFIETVKEIGLGVPNTLLIKNTREMDTALENFTDRSILKPVYSRFGAYTVVADGDLNISELNISESNPWVVQEFIEGRQVCTTSSFYEGEMLNHTAYGSEFHLNMGAHFEFKVLSESKVQDWVEEIGKELKLTGNFGFDFILDKNNKIFPLECNPRPTSGVFLFQENCEKYCDAIFEKKKGVVVTEVSSTPEIKPMMLMYGLKKIRTFKKFKEWLRGFIFGKDIVFSMSDPLPFFMLPFIFAWLPVETRKFKLPRVEMGSAGIKYDGQIK